MEEKWKLLITETRYLLDYCPTCPSSQVYIFFPTMSFFSLAHTLWRRGGSRETSLLFANPDRRVWWGGGQSLLLCLQGQRKQPQTWTVAIQIKYQNCIFFFTVRGIRHWNWLPRWWSCHPWRHSSGLRIWHWVIWFSSLGVTVVALGWRVD